MQYDTFIHNNSQFKKKNNGVFRPIRFYITSGFVKYKKAIYSVLTLPHLLLPLKTTMHISSKLLYTATLK